MCRWITTEIVKWVLHYQKLLRLLGSLWTVISHSQLHIIKLCKSCFYHIRAKCHIASAHTKDMQQSIPCSIVYFQQSSSCNSLRSWNGQDSRHPLQIQVFWLSHVAELSWALVNNMLMSIPVFSDAWNLFLPSIHYFLLGFRWLGI